MPLAALLALALAAAHPAAAHPAAPPGKSPMTVPATLQNAVQFDMASRFTGRTHRIYLSVPEGPAPKDGWPILFLMDGDEAFPMGLFQMPSDDGPDRRRAILVGVGYGKPRKDVRGLRNRELTPSQPDAATRAIGQWKPGEGEFAGADNLYRFLTEELRPRLAASYPIDAKDEALIGYSLGGLFALHTLFAHPSEFRTVVAGSPSIWWNGREVLKGEAAFAEAVTAGRAAPRILITSGSLEETPAGVGAPDNPITRTLVSKAAMIGNARALADRLKALHGRPGYEVRYVLFDGEGHNSGVAASTSRAINFALEK